MRYLSRCIQKDLESKMVFLSGPRQTGKTYESKELGQQFNKRADALSRKSEYLLWDDDEDRLHIIGKRWAKNLPLIVFDELHKFPRWKNWIKGVWDKRPPGQSYLVTGSARLNVFKKGGDSLLGRYHHWRLHPFCLREKPKGMSPQECFQRLLHLGGFPEPFLANSEAKAKRWRKERADLLIREDLRDLEHVREIRNVELLLDLLKQRAASEIVFDHLRNDLQVSLDSVKRWIEALERMYACFLVRPYTGKLSRVLQRIPKIYFYDNGDVPIFPDRGLGPKFENLVACHLLKQLNFLEDRDGDRWELHYLRDKEKREIDFVVTRNGDVHELIEVKWRKQMPTAALRFYKQKLNPSLATMIFAEPAESEMSDGIRLLHVTDAFTSWER